MKSQTLLSLAGVETWSCSVFFFLGSIQDVWVQVTQLVASLIPNGTTLDLDELDEIPAEDQAKALEVADLPEDQQKLKGWRLVKAMHETACEKGRDTYIDPPSGYSVWTSR